MLSPQSGKGALQLHEPFADVEKVLSAVVEEAEAAQATDPLTYIGLRLLQHSERAIQLPPQAETAVRSVPAALAAQRLPKAEEELQALREELQRVERAEATAAMQVILSARGVQRDPSELEYWCFQHAAVEIQAGFHGLVARRWVREQRRRLSLDGGEGWETPEEVAATIIQAGFHGMLTRRWCAAGEWVS